MTNGTYYSASLYKLYYLIFGSEQPHAWKNILRYFFFFLLPTPGQLLQNLGLLQGGVVFESSCNKAI